MKRKSNEAFRRELFKRWGNKVIPLTEYINNKIKIHFHCNECGNEFDARPNDMLSGWKRWCPFCSNKIMGRNSQKTTEEYLRDLKAVHGNKFTVLEEYRENRNIPIMHRCNDCGHEWKATPHNLLSGEGCPNCKRKTIGDLKRKPVEQYKKELYEIWGNKIELLGEYKNNETKTLHRCNDCVYEWLVNPHNILQGSGCPKCNRSRGEKQTELFLEQHKIKFETQKKFDTCKKKRPLPFDFYLPDFNLLIEFQGEQHFGPVEHFGGESSFKEQLENDKIKREWCSNPENPNLIEISSIKDVEKLLSQQIKNPANN